MLEKANLLIIEKWKFLKPINLLKIYDSSFKQE